MNKQDQENEITKMKIFLNNQMEFLNRFTQMSDVVDDQIDNVKVLYRHIDEKDFINSADVIRDTKNMLKNFFNFYSICRI